MTPTATAQITSPPSNYALLPRTTAPVVDAPNPPKPQPEVQPAQADPRLAQVKTFRSLSREFFGAETARESIKELILFGWIIVVAAWPLSATLNQLGTMMISPPPGGLW